jgi:hypothetical protein
MRGIYRQKGGVRKWTRGPHLPLARPRGWPAPWGGLHHASEKIGTLAFVSSNSENISCVAFLKHKNSKNRELALWHLVSRLVLENA